MRQRVAEAIESQPEASLRTIAGQLGVSPETVRRVRNSHETQPHRRLTTAICEPMTADSIDGVLLPRQQRPVVAAWRQDNAFDATTGGVSFAEWFDSTSVDVAAGTLADVPLSRVYEIADEARRRASFWSDFAANLESRIRYRH